MHDTNLLENQPIAWTPTDEIIERSQLKRFMRQVGAETWDELYQFSIRDVEKFTEEVLKFLDIKFNPPYEKLLDTSNGVEFPQWLGGTRTPSSACADSSPRADEGVRVPSAAGLNITEMCLDRWQTDEMKDQPAVISEIEEGRAWTLNYSELNERVKTAAAGFRFLGIKKNDPVGIHLPMGLPTVIVLLAVGRIGAVAVPVFSGYGASAISSRLNAVEAKALVTCDWFPRRGKEVNAYPIAVAAVDDSSSVENLIVVGSEIGIEKPASAKVTFFEELMQAGSLGHGGTIDISSYAAEGHKSYLEMSPRDRTSAEKEGQRTAAALSYVEPTSAEDPLIILYTSGTTGKPKGIAHTHASFPIKAAQDMAFGTDVGRGTRICWYTDIGWMMGPWLIYGALINGATICLYDGAPDYPTPDRMWEFCAKHKVEVLGISPTLIRALAAHEDPGTQAPRLHERETRTGIGKSTALDNDESTPQSGVAGGPPAFPAPHERHDLSSLRAFASTGEPWNPAPWWWLFNEVGNGKLPIINYSGGTEISGGILMGNPLLPIKPCSFPAPCPGMDVDILDENGQPVGPNQVGELVIKQPWIGMARGFWQERERYLETYWSRFPNTWVHGDWAMRDSDGHWFILGRSDDTLKVAGKRVGPAEVESLLVAHPLVTEAAVIGVPDETKGTAMVAFVVMRDEGGGMKDESEHSDSSLISPPSSLSASLETELKALVSRDMGKPLAPSRIHFVSALPKTRNAKVMRRVIRAAYLGEDAGDLSALEDPKAVDGIAAVRDRP